MTPSPTFNEQILKRCLQYDFLCRFSAEKSFLRIKTAYGECSAEVTVVMRWFEQFSTGDLSIGDDPSEQNDEVKRKAPDAPMKKAGPVLTREGQLQCFLYDYLNKTSLSESWYNMKEAYPQYIHTYETIRLYRWRFDEGNYSIFKETKSTGQFPTFVHITEGGKNTPENKEDIPENDKLNSESDKMTSRDDKVTSKEDKNTSTEEKVTFDKATQTTKYKRK